MTDHDHTDLIARLDTAPWHHSPGYNRKADGTRVGKHSYILSDDGEDVRALVNQVIDIIEAKTDPCLWRGRYQGRGFVYYYLTLPDGWTYWRMRGRGIINRDHIDRAEREVIPRRARRAVQPALPDG